MLCCGERSVTGAPQKWYAQHGRDVPCIQTYPTVCCNVFLVTEGQSISDSASALQRTALTGLSLFETYDALMTPPRDDKQLKTWLYALDTWHIKLWSK